MASRNRRGHIHAVDNHSPPGRVLALSGTAGPCYAGPFPISFGPRDSDTLRRCRQGTSDTTRTHTPGTAAHHAADRDVDTSRTQAEFPLCPKDFSTVLTSENHLRPSLVNSSNSHLVVTTLVTQPSVSGVSVLFAGRVRAPFRFNRSSRQSCAARPPRCATEPEPRLSAHLDAGQAEDHRGAWHCWKARQPHRRAAGTGAALVSQWAAAPPLT
jgi:hypothetical protein